LLQPGRGRVRQVRPQHLQRHQDQLLERDVARRPEARRRPRPDRRHRRALRGGLDQPRVRHPRRRPLRRRLPAQGHPGLPRLRRNDRRRHAAAVGRGGDQRAPRGDRVEGGRHRHPRRRRRPDAGARHGGLGPRAGMNLPVYYYVLGTPLGVLGLFRWACWLVRRIPAVLYRPVLDEHRMSLSVVVPVYQEDPQIFAAAIESWLANDVDEIILVIDASDRICLEIARRYPVTVVVTTVPGKRDALRRGWRKAKPDLVALVDSDTVWAPDVAVEVCKPFADPRVGGVGTRQSVYGARGFLARITDMFLDHRYFDENASQTYLGKAVSCLSGRTAIYRRRLLLEIEDEFMDETFWGVPCLSGDDKRLTTLVLERGYLTYMQRTAEVWSTFP